MRAARGQRARVVATTTQCTYCEQPILIRERTVDHEPPRSLVRKRAVPFHGAYDYVMSCASCNALKGACTRSEFLRWLSTDPGLKWRELRADELRDGRIDPERRKMFRGAPGHAKVRAARRISKRIRKQRARHALAHGWTPETVAVQSPSTGFDKDRERWK